MLIFTNFVFFRLLSTDDNTWKFRYFSQNLGLFRGFRLKFRLSPTLIETEIVVNVNVTLKPLWFLELENFSLRAQLLFFELFEECCYNKLTLQFNSEAENDSPPLTPLRNIAQIWPSGSPPSFLSILKNWKKNKKKILIFFYLKNI